MKQNGFQSLELKLPTDYSEDDLKEAISKNLGIHDFSYTISKKSLDARKKIFIHWLVKVGVSSPELRGANPEAVEKLHIEHKKRNQKVVVVGSGPAGFFSALVLQKAGFSVTLLEQGTPVESRIKDICDFEKTGNLNPYSNYAYGEGGAGTFSDGKLTSRTKTIGKEKQFVFETFIQAGAPQEIGYLAHPHIGSDNLTKIVPNMRKEFQALGGEILFHERAKDIQIKGSKVISLVTENNDFPADYFIFAPGHSSYETYRMLLKNGIPFQNKPFAIGFRAEHPQEIINLAQWNQKSLKGVKSAEYRLTFNQPGLLPVYSFCMCPGGKVVPAAPSKGLCVVNGVSNYARNSQWANAAVVAGIQLEELLGTKLSPLEALSWIEQLEQKTFEISGDYQVPANTIKDFMQKKTGASLPSTSYPFKLYPFEFETLFHRKISESLREGLKDFCKKIRGFEKGIVLGLETKTSSPIQAIRSETGASVGFENLFICGEASGRAGGIVSSASDGIIAATKIIGE